MPSNTTSLIQPLDPGFIRTVKVYYRSQLIGQMVIAIDDGVKLDAFARSVFVLKALYMLKHEFFCLAHLPFVFASEKQVLSCMF